MSPAATGLFEALLAVQAEVPTLRKDATNPHFRSKFTPLDTIVETVGPILNKHGLIWQTFPTVDDHGAPALRYKLTHASTGQSESDTMRLLLTKDDPQGQGSALTYARRYSLCAVLNLVADDDDDGHQASQPNAAGASSGPSGRTSSSASPSEKQLDYLKSLIKQHQPPDYTLRAMLDAVDADGVDPTKDGWSKALKRDQVSRLIEAFKLGPLPTGKSDIPDDAPEFEPANVGEGDDVPFA